MPHLRKRILEALLKESLGWSPVTAVFGQRQTGKTTLLKALSKSSETFDKADFILEFETQSSQILEAAPKPLFLDEVQKYPPVFDALKAAADQKRRPGQFLITGSVRFAQRKPIRESLTGRTTLWELLPLTTSELQETAFRHLFKDMLSPKPLETFQKKLEIKPSLILKQFVHGGLPGICFVRSTPQRDNSLRNHLATLLDRDLPLIRDTKTPPTQLLNLLRSLVPLQGEPLQLAGLARKLHLSAPTVKALLHAMEGLFLIRTHGHTVYFEDLGISHWLNPMAMSETGRHEQQWIFSELRAQAVYRPDDILTFGEHRTRGGAYVPFVFELRDGTTIGITYDPLERPSEKSLKSMQSLRKRSRRRTLALHLHSGQRAWESGKDALCVPYFWIA